MDAKGIAAALERIAVLLELQGENPFKVRAYRNGARIVENLPEDLAKLVAENRLGEVEGLGAALTDKIATLHRDGSLPFLDRLEASFPPGLTRLLGIPGLGPKKLKALHERLGVSDAATLKSACLEGRVASLEGFGEKTQAKLLEGLEHLDAWSRRHAAVAAAPIADRIVAMLRAIPDVARVEAAGSLRRGLETVGDLDFIVGAVDGTAAMDAFVALPEVASVLGRGPTKASVRFQSGLQADLRVVPPEGFIFALHHFTGSKDHHVKLRHHALGRGWSLGEWGLAPAKPDEPPAGWDPASPPRVENEDALYRFLGLHPVPPELREGLDELDQAARGPLPTLVTRGDLRGAFHAHTHASDGTASLEEMVRAAEAAGLEYLGITDHSRSSYQANGLDVDRLLAQVEEIRALNASGRFRCHVFAGSEVDILRDGSLDFPDEVLAKLDFVIASVHASFGLPADVMTDRIVRAMENPHVTMLGHATGRLILRREPYAVEMPRLLEAARRTGVVIELNAAPERLDLDWRHWRSPMAAGLPTSINPDAHDPDDFAWLDRGVVAARKAGFTPDRVINTKPLAEVRTWLANRRHGSPAV